MTYDTSTYSQESADSAWLRGNLGEYKQLSLWNLTQTDNPYCDRNSQTYLSTQISETTAPVGKPSTLSRWDFLVREQVKRERDQDCPTQNQHYGEKGLDVSSKPNPNSASLNNLMELSDEDLEQSLDSSSWRDIVGNLKSSRLQALGLVIKDSDYLSFPTLTSGKNSSKTRPAGQTKCEKWFKDKELIPNGSQLSAQAIAMIMGYPPNWFNILLPIAAQAESKPDISQVAQLPQVKQRSHWKELLNSTAINKTVIPNPASEAVIPNPASEAVIPNPASEAVIPNPASGAVIPNPASEAVIPKRKKGEGSGSIYLRTITKKNKEYLQAYFHYEIWSSKTKITKSCRYIPKHKQELVRSLNQDKVPIKVILNLLNN